MAWGAIGGAVAGAVVSSALSDSGGGGGGGTYGGQNTAAGGTVYDPFASHRPQFGRQLAAMMTPGATFTSADPSYAFRYGQGLEAVNRTEAAKGMLGSGNRLMDLMNYGQGMASTEFGNQFNRLASLAGVSQTMGSGYGQLQAQQNSLMSQGVGNIFGALGGAFNSGYFGGGGYQGFGAGTGGSGYNIGGEQGAMLAAQWD